MNSLEILKKCGHCKCKKKLEDFTAKSDGRLKFVCRQCERSGEKQWRQKRKKKDPTYRVEYNEVRNCRKFGITPLEKFHMYSTQDGVCAICGIKTALSIDHCHQTNKVRGLLCSPCNKSIGMMRENSDALRKAAEYVEFYKSQPGPIDMLREQRLIPA